MREDGKTIALLYHATGVGKTITAATDAKAVGGRTLFLVNALKLASQAKETFAKVWPPLRNAAMARICWSCSRMSLTKWI